VSIIIFLFMSLEGLRLRGEDLVADENCSSFCASHQPPKSRHCHYTDSFLAVLIAFCNCVTAPLLTIVVDCSRVVVNVVCGSMYRLLSI